MGRGKSVIKNDNTAGNPRTFRIDDEMWDELQVLGEGNATAGLYKMYEQYKENGMKQMDETMVVSTVHKELTTLLDKGLQQYFIKAVNFWIRNNYEPATIEKYCKVFGVTERDSIVTGKIMKRLQGQGVMVLGTGGFRPDIRCNNGISDEMFLKYFEKYSDIVQKTPEIEDLTPKIRDLVDDILPLEFGGDN